MCEDMGDNGEFDQSSEEMDGGYEYEQAEDAAIDANDDPYGHEWDGGWDNEIDSGRWDDDPNPYDGTYSEE